MFLRFAATTEERLKHLVANRKSDKPSPYARGTWTFSFALFGDFDQPSPAELLAKLRSIRGETGWSPWHIFTKDGMKPYARDGLVECWLEKNSFGPGHADFWRATPDGRFSLIRAFEEDFLKGVDPSSSGSVSGSVGSRVGGSYRVFPEE